MAGASSQILRQTQIIGLTKFQKKEGEPPSVILEFESLAKAQNAYAKALLAKDFMPYVKLSDISKENSFEVTGIRMIGIKADGLIREAEKAMATSYKVFNSVPVNALFQKLSRFHLGQKE